MIRSILISALFFFGPAILMFLLRNLFLFLRVWMRLRQLRKQQDEDVIDITPHKHGSPSMLFNIAAIIVGLTCAFLAWQEMNSEPGSERRYVPAYVDKQGNVVPGRMEPVEEPSTPDQ